MRVYVCVCGGGGRPSPTQIGCRGLFLMTKQKNIRDIHWKINIIHYSNLSSFKFSNLKYSEVDQSLAHVVLTYPRYRLTSDRFLLLIQQTKIL